ncbi:hypothetical protein QBC47DRAFT_131799 [Echria macrotheca]|uniref:Rhodopsin domain-containing protein n=1 Tax=Echria macrotheca TaxID=438768 RepID=A0AAJ0BGS9_9PEZI|nr:hypothetical protein QBC47DRAFT_131799 [Echria macrotheca]
MGLGGEAPWALGVMWMLAGLVLFLLVLRLYTRIVCLASYGIDDHVYIVAFVFLLIFTIFTHISGLYGFGQTPEEIGNIDHVVLATLYECIGQGFAIVGMAIAKCSLGFFLLRLVTLRWHRIAIWSAMGLVSAASIAQVLCFWLSCVPLNYVYDRRIPGGYCPIDTRPTSYILCVSTILVDLFFAVFPWIIVWDLHMPKREKYTIAGSMSLGLIAAAAGIKRTTEVGGLYTPEYLRDSVGLIVWSSAEMAVTLICIGIPVCRPLYKRMFQRLFGDIATSSSGYHKQSDAKGASSLALRTIGGGMVGPDGKPLPKNMTPGTSVHTADNKSGDEASFSDVKLGVNGPFTHTTVGRGSRNEGDQHSHRADADNASDEEILDEYRRSQMQRKDSDVEEGRRQRGGGEPRTSHGIVVTETYRVERS